MTDLAWMAVCGLSMAAMGAVYLIDRHRWRRRAHLLALLAQAATMGLQHARRVRKLQVRHYMDEANAFYAQKQAAEGRVDGLEAAMIEIRRIAAKKIKKIDGLQAFPAEAVHHLASCNCSCQGNAIQANANYHNSECMVGRAQQFLAAGGDDRDWGRPITVGDPEVDPLYAEISFCGPRHVAVYMRVTDRSVKSSFIRILSSHDGDQVTVYDGLRPILDAYEGVGFAQAGNVEKIVDAVRRHNGSFHEAKGVGDAGVVQEETRGDRDRPGCDDHGSGDPRRQGADRRQCADRGACPSP